MPDKLYSIKEISELCNLSRRQLLYYEDKGLITNVSRGDNNYRYYTKNHLARLVFIKESRGIGLPIDAIAKLLANPTIPTLKTAIRQGMVSAQQELDASLSKYQQSMGRYQSLLESAYICESYVNHQRDLPIEVVEFPASYVVCYECNGRFEDDSFDFYQRFAKLDAIVQAHGLTKTSPRFFAFHNHFCPEAQEFLDQDCEIKLFYRVKEAESLCKYWQKLPGFPAVFSLVLGKNYTDLKQQYLRMLAWAKAQGYKLAATSYEETLLEIGFAEFWVSKIYIPILK